MDDFDSLDSPIFELVKAISKNDLDAGLRGDVEAAIRNYEMSLALNPDNTNAAARIKAIREKINN